MPQLSLDLDSVTPGNDLPGPPHALIFLKSTDSSGKSQLGYITPECFSVRQFESEIDRLHKELDWILIRAKNQFSAHNQQDNNAIEEKADASMLPNPNLRR